jgi:hypothetical protein
LIKSWKGTAMKALSAALVLGLAALGSASSASADTRVRIYAQVPGAYYAQPARVYYGPPRYYGEPDWRARRAWREDQWRRAQWERREAWRHEHWRREHWRNEERRRGHWRD